MLPFIFGARIHVYIFIYVMVLCGLKLKHTLSKGPDTSAILDFVNNKQNEKNKEKHTYAHVVARFQLPTDGPRQEMLCGHGRATSRRCHISLGQTLTHTLPKI